MSAGLFGEIYSTKPVWHNFAHVMPEAHTAEMAAQVSNVLFEIEKAPVTTFSKWGAMEDGKYNLVRGPVPGVDEMPAIIANAVSPEYTILQNQDYVDLLQGLSERYPIETMGALKNGQVFFTSIKAGEWMVKDEPVTQYFVVQDTRDGKTGFWMRATPVAPVCMNTLAMGAARATIAVNLNHSESLLQGVTYGVEVFSQMIAKANEQTLSALELLSRVTITPADATRLIEKIFTFSKPRKQVATAQELGPEVESLTEQLFGFALEKSKKDQEYAAGLVQKQREWTMQAFEWQSQNETEARANTLYGFVNAVAYVEQYRPGKEGRDVDVVLGTRRATIAKAFEMAYQMAAERDGETHKTQY